MDFDQNYKQKAEKFYECLKNCGFEQINEFRANSFECFFQVPETQSFFNWFLENSNEFYYLSKEEIRLFKEKEAKGHVITDLNKLEEMHAFINFNKHQDKSVIDENSFEDSIESLKKEIEFQENICKKISGFVEIRANHRNELNLELKELQNELENFEVQKTALDKKSNYLGNNLKVLNQNLFKSLAEFKKKFGDEDKFTQKGFDDLNNLEFTIDEYLKCEKKLLNSIKENMFLKFDFDGVSAKPIKVGSFKENEILFELSQDSDETIRNHLEFFCQNNELFSDLDLDYIKEFEKKNKKIELQNIHDTLKILANSYPNLIEKYLETLLSYELSNIVLEKLNKINDTKEEFFAFCNEKNLNNAYYRQHVEETIKNFEKKAEIYDQKNKILVERIENSVEKLSGLKVTQVLDVELDKKKIEHSLFSNKQDKLLKALEAQKCRVEYKDFFQDLRLNELESLQVLLEEINRNKSIYTSPTKSSSSFYAYTSISKENSTLGNSFVSTSMNNMNNVLQNEQNVLNFKEKNVLATSVSMANLNNIGSFYAGPTNSTILLSPSRSSQNINYFRSKKQPIMNISKVTNNPFTDLQLSAPPIFQDLSNNSIESKYIYILNQNLIKFLTEINSDENINRFFKLEKQISTNFKDNLEILIEMKRCINEAYKTKKVVNAHQQLASLNDVIGKAIEYLYEKDEDRSVDAVGSAKMYTLRYDFKESMIKMPKFLKEPLQNLEKIRSELENNFINILTKYGNYKKKLESSNLQQLQRNFLVEFYTNPRQVEKTINYLNSINFES